MKEANFLNYGIYEKVTLSGKKSSGRSDENLKGVTKFFSDEIFPRRKISPNFYHPNKSFTRFFLSHTETFTQNFILRPKIKSKFLHPELQKVEVTKF